MDLFREVLPAVSGLNLLHPGSSLSLHWLQKSYPDLQTLRSYPILGFHVQYHKPFFCEVLCQPDVPELYLFRHRVPKEEELRQAWCFLPRMDTGQMIHQYLLFRLLPEDVPHHQSYPSFSYHIP